MCHSENAIRTIDETRRSAQESPGNERRREQAAPSGVRIANAWTLPFVKTLLDETQQCQHKSFWLFSPAVRAPLPASSCRTLEPRVLRSV